jgi:hypothetical protein
VGLVVAVAFVLNLTPFGLTPVAWLAFVVLAGAASALWLRGRAPLPLHIPVARHEVLLGGAAVLLATGAFVAARAFANLPAESFTQLWLVPRAGSASVLTVGVVSYEAGPVRYRLELLRDGAVVETWSIGPLEPGGRWETVVTVARGAFEARLYRGDDPTRVYRHVSVDLTAANVGEG